MTIVRKFEGDWTVLFRLPVSLSFSILSPSQFEIGLTNPIELN